MNEFEEVLDDAEVETNWSTKSKLAVVLEFLEEHCSEKLSDFQDFVQIKVSDEIDS